MIKGATDKTSTEYNDQADFGQDNQYVVSFYRASRYTKYNALSDYEYQTTGNLNSWWREDADDWDGKIGYADEVILRDSLPPILSLIHISIFLVMLRLQSAYKKAG